MSEHPSFRIRCAICDRPVERWECWEDPRTMSQKLVVYCHGDKDAMSLSFRDMAEMGPGELRRMAASEGVAFTTKRLPTPPVAPNLAQGGETL